MYVYVVYEDCEQNLCQNGGTCQIIAGDYLCICAAGFTGLDCGRLNYKYIIIHYIGSSISSTIYGSTITTSLMSTTSLTPSGDDTALSDINIGLIGGAVGAAVAICVCLVIVLLVVVISVLVYKKRALSSDEFKVVNPAYGKSSIQ